MSFDAHKNLAYSTVATAPTPASSGTTLVLDSGGGGRFPTVPFNATIWPTGVIPTPANSEIVRVTNISTDTLTITRAQEGTSARSVIVGDQIAAAATAKTFTDIETAVSAALTTGTAAGGDLSGTYPNPSVQDDSHAHSASTLTGVVKSGDAAGGDLSGTYPNPSVSDDSHAHTGTTLSGVVKSGDAAGGDLTGTYPNPTGDATKLMKLAGSQTVTGAKTFNAGTVLDKGSLVYDVKAYGAVGDDSTDDTTAIQAALTACGNAGGGTVYVPKGTYKVTATLTMAKFVNLRGEGLGASRLHRTTDYGDTLTIGTVGAGGNGAQSVSVKGLWFYYTAGSWTGTPRHIVLNHAQDADISGNWFYGLDGQIYCDGGTKIAIHDNLFGASGAVGSYSIKVIKESSDGSLPTDIIIRDNYIAATGYTRGIVVETIESIDITGGYIGGYVTNSVYFNAKTIVSGVRISVPFLDPASTGNTVEFDYSDTYAIGVTISGCNFYGAAGPTHHIKSNHSTTHPSVVNLNISGNTFRDSAKASINLLGVFGAVVSGNVFLNYNATHTSTTDPATASGIYIAGGGTAGVSRNLNVEGNIFGATGTVDWATAGDTNNYAVWGVYTDSTGTSANITLEGNAGLFRTGGALYAGDVAANPPSGAAGGGLSGTYPSPTVVNDGHSHTASTLPAEIATLEGAWTAYTPTVSAQSGSYTSVSAAGRYLQVGKTVFFRFSVTVTTNGTAGTATIATLPVAAHATNEFVFAGRNNTTGVMMVGYLISGTSNVFMTNYSGAYAAGDGQTILMSGSYEAA